MLWLGESEMKKFNKHLLSFVFALIFIAPTMVLFSGCKKAESGDTLFVNIQHNSANASWSSSYIKKHGTKDNSFIVNRYDYVSWIDSLPDTNDLSAPSGMAFAGWYFDSACSKGNSFTLLNWEQKAIKNSQPTSINAYAHWIDQNYVDVILDLDNNEAKFADSNLKSTVISVPKSDLDNILSYLPTKDNPQDIELKNSSFAGWSLQTSYNTKVYSKSEASVSAIKTAIGSNSYVKLYAMWDYDVLDMIEFNFNVISPSGTTASINLNHFIKRKENQSYQHPYAHRVITWSSGSSQSLICRVFKDDSFDLMKSYVPTMNDVKVTTSSGKDVSSSYKIVGYKIKFENNELVDWSADYIPSNLWTDEELATQYDSQVFSIYIVLGKN
jgi:hypothetical protein